MKTTVSLPDELFRQYAAALTEYLNRRRDESVTERLNKVYSKHSSKLGPAWENAMRETRGKERW
jgi:hypothetical protein